MRLYIQFRLFDLIAQIDILWIIDFPTPSHDVPLTARNGLLPVKILSAMVVVIIKMEFDWVKTALSWARFTKTFSFILVCPTLKWKLQVRHEHTIYIWGNAKHVFWCCISLDINVWYTLILDVASTCRRQWIDAKFTLWLRLLTSSEVKPIFEKSKPMLNLRNSINVWRYICKIFVQNVNYHRIPLSC